LSKNGEDDAVVNFESLELEEGENPSQKLTALMEYLEANMEPEKYAEALTLLGVKKEMSNAERLEAIKGLMTPKEKEEEEKEDPDKMAEGDDKPDRAAFMKTCMEGGKSLEECTEEWKKKYPDPEKPAEKAGEPEIPKALADQMKAMGDRIAELEGLKELAEVSTEVEKLVEEKHLAPVQRDAIIKLSAKMDPEARTEFLGFFRATQKISVHNDVGVITSDKPGAAGGNDITPERKKQLILLHGLDGLIEDKADRTKLPWGGNN